MKSLLLKSVFIRFEIETNYITKILHLDLRHLREPVLCSLAILRCVFALVSCQESEYHKQGFKW